MNGYTAEMELDSARIAKRSPDIKPDRRDKIVRIRDEIRRGAFETKERLEMLAFKIEAELLGYLS